jgi:hypothetical protein
VGATKTALVICLVAATGRAHADSCTGTSTEGHPFAACFDPGNRLSVVADTSDITASIQLRHIIHFADEPDLVWKMEHTILQASHGDFEARFSGLLYRGVYIRHSRDGHIVLPWGNPPAKLFLPFDVGALVEFGGFSYRPDATADVEVVKTAALIDVARSRDQRMRLAFGPVASWDIALDRMPELAVHDHAISPFSSGLVTLHLESADGLESGDVRVQSGLVWHGTRGWVMQTTADASVERVLIAVNDRPVAVTLGVRYDSVTDETTAGVGLRVVLVQRTDPRVSLDPPLKP